MHIILKSVHFIFIFCLSICKLDFYIFAIIMIDKSYNPNSNKSSSN